jgi:hypothetical protein
MDKGRKGARNEDIKGIIPGWIPKGTFHSLNLIRYSLNIMGNIWVVHLIFRPFPERNNFSHI